MNEFDVAVQVSNLVLESFTMNSLRCLSNSRLLLLSRGKLVKDIVVMFVIRCLFEGLMLHLRTPDEDFGILLEAAVMYDRRVAAILNEDDSTEVDWKEMWDEKQYLYPRLLFIITGIF